MKSRHIVSLLVAAGLLAAAAAIAAEAAKKTPPPDVKKEVVRVEVRDGEEHGALGWEDDDLGWFALGDEDFDVMEFGDDAGGSGGDRRIVIRRGPGMGRHGGMGMRGGMGRGHGRGMGMGPGAGMHRAFAALDLTEAQREKMADLHERQQRKAIQARADLQLARMDLHKLMRADAPSASAINAQIDRVSKLQADQHKSRAATFLEARGLLTPEQQKQLKAMRGPGPGRGAGPGAGPQVQKRLRLHHPPAGGEQKSD